MINKGGKLKTIAHLRQNAEEIAKNNPSDRPSQLSEVDSLKLLHELKVYRIELELIKDQLILTNKELLLQNKEKEKQAKKLIKANKEIRESEEKFKSIVQSQTEGIGFVNQNEIFEFANKAAIRIFETESNELIGTNLRDFLRPEDWNNIVQQTSQRKSGKANSYEIQIVTKKGNLKYIHVSATPKFDENRNYLGAYAIFRDITEKTEAEIKLKASEDRFKKLSEHSRVITWEVDSNGLYTYISQTCMTVLGYQPEEIVGKKYFYDLHPLGERESFKKAAFEVFARKESFRNLENAIETKDGKQLCVSTNGIPILDDNKSLLAYRGTDSDITERKLAEEALHHSEALIRAITESAQDAILMMNAEGVITYLNPAAENIFGYTGSEAIGQNLHELIVPLRYHKAHYAAFPKFQQTGQGAAIGKLLDMEARRKDGTEIPVQLSLSATQINNSWYSVGIIRDLTERKLMVEEKRNIDDKIRTLSLAITQSPVTTVITDLAGNIEYVNPKFTEVTGYTAEEAIGQNTRILNAGNKPNSEYQELWSKIMSGQNWHGIFLNKKKNGDLFWESAVISPVKNAEGTLTHFLAVKEDITERIKSEQELKLKNEELVKLNAEKNKFFSIISHDLRGPLGGFMGLTEMLTEESQDFTEDEKKEAISALNDLAHNTFKLLENLLEWAQMDRGVLTFNPEKIDLKTAVTECVKIAAESARVKDIEIVSELADEPEVFADNNMLHTVIRNLLSNAIKFTPVGGKVFVSAETAENKPIVISVKDTGIGMNDEIRNNIFRIDVKTKRPGTQGEPSTGLGLLLCKEFIERHGGEIRVESEEGKGSIFSFTLPAASTKLKE